MPGLNLVWEIWDVVSRSRQTGFGACPLTASDISAVLDAYNIKGRSRLEYFHYILALDDEWLGWQRDRKNNGDSSDSDRCEEGKNRRDPGQKVN